MTVCACPPAEGRGQRDGAAGGLRQHAGGETTAGQPASYQRPARVQERTPAHHPTHPPPTWYVPKTQCHTRQSSPCCKCVVAFVMPAPSQGACPHGKFDNVTGPRVQTAGEYPGSHKYGAWGRDPRPAAGQESWHWMVMLTSSNKYGHYVRMYTSLSSLIVGVSTPGKQPDSLLLVSDRIHVSMTGYTLV